MELLGLVLTLAGVAAVVIGFFLMLLWRARWAAVLLPVMLVGIVAIFVGAEVSERAREESFADRCIELGGVVGRPGELCLTRWSDGTSPVIEVP